MLICNIDVLENDFFLILSNPFKTAPKKKCIKKILYTRDFVMHVWTYLVIVPK